jgi:hypothetical protein
MRRAWFGLWFGLGWVWGVIVRSVADMELGMSSGYERGRG